MLDFELSLVGYALHLTGLMAQVSWRKPEARERRERRKEWRKKGSILRSARREGKDQRLEAVRGTPTAQACASVSLSLSSLSSDSPRFRGKEFESMQSE